MGLVGVVLADDHPVVIDGLCRYFALQKDLSILATAGSYEALCAAISEHRPSVVVVDLHMPGMQGAQSIRDLVSDAAAPRVIIFSMQEEDSYAASLVHAGAFSFLSKSRSPEELANAVRAAAKGERYVTAVVDASAPHEAFSQREREVFERLVDGRTSKDIGFELGLSVSTVHTYAERIRNKLGVDSAHGLLDYAFKHHLRR